MGHSIWSSSQKQALDNAFLSAWNPSSLTLIDPPPNIVNPDDDEHATTVLAHSNAWPMFLAHVAQSLAVEIGEWVNWSIRSYSSNNLKILFDGREFFEWDGNYAGYRIEQSKGRVVPAPPKHMFAFLSNNDCIAYNKLYTISGLLEWCRSNLVHFSGGADAQNMENQWQYRGYPPISRIISGTPFTGNPHYGIVHRTAGCRGTCGFLRSVLRVVNIPVEQVHVCGHALPHFITENRYLSHGYDIFKENYTVSQLEAEELWERMDEKINSFGGCSHIP